MKIIKSQKLPSRPYSDDNWEYKGYKCNISYDVESDNVKAYHNVITPQGQSISADINPYDGSRKTFEMWIDAGMPPREGSGPWDQARLVQKLQGGNTLSFVNYFNLKKEAQSFEQPHKGILPPKSNDTEWLTNQEPKETCSRCRQPKSDVEARYSYGIYAGKYCGECAYKGYRDHCGLIKHPNGTYTKGNQGNTRDLEDMGEQIEPL